MDISFILLFIHHLMVQYNHFHLYMALMNFHNMVIDLCSQIQFYLVHFMLISFSRYLVFDILLLKMTILVIIEILTFIQWTGSNSLWFSLNLGLSLIKGYSIPVLGKKICCYFPPLFIYYNWFYVLTKFI